MNKYKCLNNECFLSMMALSNPRVCPRCGCAGMREQEEAAHAFDIPSDVPSAIHEMREMDEKEILNEVDDGMIKLMSYLQRGDDGVSA